MWGERKKKAFWATGCTSLSNHWARVRSVAHAVSFLDANLYLFFTCIALICLRYLLRSQPKEAQIPEVYCDMRPVYGRLVIISSRASPDSQSTSEPCSPLCHAEHSKVSECSERSDVGYAWASSSTLRCRPKILLYPVIYSLLKKIKNHRMKDVKCQEGRSLKSAQQV